MRIAAFRQHPQWNEGRNPLVEDGLHPSPAGNQLWAEYLAEKLAPVIESCSRGALSPRPARTPTERRGYNNVKP